jgi:CRP/FNR family transcriptional regulator, cyclic AMP receptor protein
MDAAAGKPQGPPALPDALRTLAARGQPRRYRKGVMLIQEGDQGDTLFIVLTGCVKAFSVDDRDREITYGTYGPGEYLGEMSLDGGPRSASVITLEPTECVVVSRQALREHIAANPEFAFELLNRVIRRARIATENARNLALLDVYGRLVKVLEAMADDDGLVPGRPTHQDLANRVGSSREMVSRLMKDLARGGYVTAEGRVLRIKRPLPSSW